jgi:hypothetical protein
MLQICRYDRPDVGFPLAVRKTALHVTRSYSTRQVDHINSQGSEQYHKEKEPPAGEDIPTIAEIARLT